MVTTTETIIQAKRVFVIGVQEAPWNVNVLQGEKYEQLGVDMKVASPEGTDPIDTCVLNGEKFTCDGSHRLRWARKLGWPYLYEIFHPEITTEEQARLFNFKRDFERGDIDPFKLAASFKWFVDKGLTQKQIGDKFGVDEKTVSRRISLLNVDPEAKKQILSNTAFTVSHLEPIATLPAEKQRELVQEVQKRSSWEGPMTVRDVEQEVQMVKKQIEKDAKFEAALAKAKFPKCPVEGCGKAGVPHGWKELPWALCESGLQGHIWNINTGLTEAADRSRAVNEERKAQGLPPQKAPPIDYFRSSHTEKEFQELFSEMAKALLPKFDRITTLRIQGKSKDGKGLSLDVNGYYGTSFDADGSGFGPGEEHYFAVEEKKYEAEHLKDYHSVVRGHGAHGKALEELEEEATKLFAKYGPKVPHGTKPKSTK